MDKWEYKNIYVPHNEGTDGYRKQQEEREENLEGTLNSYGAQGWEVAVMFDRYGFLLKRRLP